MCALHGGDWAGYLAEFGALPLDFSANTSPLGLPPGVRLWRSQPMRYPSCSTMRTAMSSACSRVAWA